MNMVAHAQGTIQKSEKSILFVYSSPKIHWYPLFNILFKSYSHKQSMELYLMSLTYQTGHADSKKYLRWKKVGQIVSVVDVLIFLSQILLIHAFSVLLTWLNLCKSRISWGSRKSPHGKNLAELFEFMPRINEKCVARKIPCFVICWLAIFFSDHLDTFQIIQIIFR